MEASTKPATTLLSQDRSMSSETFAVELHQVVRRFGQIPALSKVSLSVRRGEFFSLLGPSGCGKTTLLRLIAGLDLPDEGTVRIDGVDTVDVPAHKRPVNTVFQSYALFPHLSVFDNVVFGLRMNRVSPAELTPRARRVMDMLEITPLSDRRPAQLSGGQKQRVALARAIINEPRVLLLDEPLGALDLQLRRQLRAELHGLQRRLGITFIYVTHDQEEALTTSDRIAVMNVGRIEQLGVPEELYERPRTRFVAQFLGSCNLLEGTVQSLGGSCVSVQTAAGLLRVESALSGQTLLHARLTLAIRPEKVVLNPGDDHSNRLRARVEELVYNGAETQYLLRSGGQTLRACMMNARPGQAGLRVGDEISAHLPPDGLILLED
jgi:spermidine/putrescine transport system ATP-binding protein